MRVVVDTNVFVGACIGRGASSQVIEACLRKRVQAFISAALLTEYRDVITRPELFRRARMDKRERGILLRAFVARCQWQVIHFNWRPNLPDEADNHIMELAIAANASMIVTRNVRDFIRPELRFPNVEIVQPEQLIERLPL